MRLDEIFSACQCESTESWLPVAAPGFPGVAVEEVQLETGEIVARPVSSVHRAVFTPDAQLQLAWGIDDRESNDETWTFWVPDSLSVVDASFDYALILVNGVPVWRVKTTLLNWGGGELATIVQPDRTGDGGWKLTNWAVSFGKLLTSLSQGRQSRDPYKAMQEDGFRIEAGGSPLEGHGPKYEAPASW